MKSSQDKEKVVFENVWQKNLAGVGEEVEQIWRRHGGPIGANAQERLRQLVFVLRAGDGAIVGVSTAFKVYVKQLRNYFFAIRLLLVPEYRIPGLTSKTLLATRDFLESIHLQEGVDPAIGIITLVENDRLKEKRNEAIWPASRMVYIGNSPEGHHIRVYYFKGARIKP